jgi:UDP-N-acetylglucosamine acyltransferase
VQIDKGTRIREFVTINAGTVNHTTVGKHCLIMAHSHIGHDAVLENGITVSTGAKIGGHSKLLHYCNIGMNAVLHQRTTIGQYAIVAAGAAVVKDVLPCSKYIPGKPVGINIHAIEKYSLFKDEIDQLHDFGWNSVSTLTWDTLLWVDAYRELDRIMAEKRDKSRDIYSKGVW